MCGWSMRLIRLRGGLEAAHELRMAHQLPAEDTQRDLAADRRLVRAMHFAELSGADEFTQFVSRDRAFGATRDRWRQPVDTQRREVGAELPADQLIDVDARVEPDDVEPSERFGCPADFRTGCERIVGGRRQEDLSWVGSGDKPCGTGERRTDRFVVAQFEIADVDRDAGAVVHDRTCGPDGTDRIAEHHVARRSPSGSASCRPPARRPHPGRRRADGRPRPAPTDHAIRRRRRSATNTARR